MAMMGAILCPAGLFWFAWYVSPPSCVVHSLINLICSRTSLPPVHWIVPILAGIPYGIGVAQIMTGLVQYLMDTYTIYCASAIASTVILRSILAAVFPLISPAMYSNLGAHWAPTIFAFLSLVCLPLPFLFYVSPDVVRGLRTEVLIGFVVEIWALDTEQVKVRECRAGTPCYEADTVS